MSSVGDKPTVYDHEVEDSPRFDLDYLLDDITNPTEVTIHAPDEDELTTYWITIDIDHAIPLEAIQ